MTRLENQNSIIQRKRSVKDISRSEKHYLNFAYDDQSCNVSDDEGEFMVQVDLGKPRKKSLAGVSTMPRTVGNRVFGATDAPAVFERIDLSWGVIQ